MSNLYFPLFCEVSMLLFELFLKKSFAFEFPLLTLEAILFRGATELWCCVGFLDASFVTRKVGS